LSRFDHSHLETRSRLLKETEPALQKLVVKIHTLDLTTVRTKNSLLNPTTFFLGLLAPIPIVVYPLIKRYNLPDQWQHSRASWLLRPQLFLGLTFNWGAMMGYSAVTDNIDLAVQIPLYLGCVAWTVMYDTVYALQEKLQILFHIYAMSCRQKMLIF